MNAGLGSLLDLKTRLLPPQSRSQTDSDAEIVAIGLGTARWFERYCDRRFARCVGDTYLCRADRSYVVVPRYPLEDVALVETLAIGETQWTPVTQVWQLYPYAGMLDLGGTFGSAAAQLRVTYTGGWWWDETEDGSGVLPAGAFALPDDLRFAWHEQSAFLFGRSQRLGLEKIAQHGTFEIASLDFLPHVAEILGGYRRISR